ncbi:hypothetical protein [Parasitella parasitica]|uniref:MIT domain-containing protein n=1 Tax=Parasitella parasitica TaxID=35722 RepID=A0A0B7NK34_9FUNG|nr:hypothetical protein [Parasitella parasitica]
MNSESPTNTATENFEDNENWLKAAEAHSRAAEQFEIAIQDSVDDEAIRTLRLLSSNHRKKADELNRKAQRLIKAAAKTRMHHMVGSRGGLRHALSSSQQQQYHHHHHQPPEYSTSSASSSIISRLAGIHSSTVDSEDIGESYTLLPNIERQELDFLNFFESVNKLVDKVCNPAVAFTSAPLNEHDNPIPELEEKSTILQQSHNGGAMMESYFIVADPKDEFMVNNLQKQLDSLSINSASASAAENANTPKLENEKLRAQLTHLNKRLKQLQASAQENDMLKSSVLQFRDDVHKQAKRIMQSHHESSLRSSSSLIAANPSMLHGSRYSPLGSGGGDLGTYIAKKIIKIWPNLFAVSVSPKRPGRRKQTAKVAEREAKGASE